MPETIDLVAGGWARFNQYEVCDGYIRPVLGAQLLFYDPWEAYRSAPHGRGEADPPYQSLLRLVEGLRVAAAAQDLSRLADWCSQHGLLGVLLQRAQMAVLYPRFRPLPGGMRVSVEEAGEEHVPSSVLWSAVRCYFRSSIGWAVREMSGDNAVFMTDAPEREDELAPSDRIPSGAPPLGALLQDLRRAQWQFEPLDGTWGRFFPNVPEDQRATYFYPPPMSENFWRMYAEPVDAFIDGALALYQAIAGLRHVKPFADVSEEDRIEGARGLDILHALTSTVRVTIVPQADGTVRQRWLAPSLLASYAMMVLQDLTEHRRPRACEKCGNLFTSPAYQARYCSPRCRQAAQKRAYREKKSKVNGRSN